MHTSSSVRARLLWLVPVLLLVSFVSGGFAGGQAQASTTLHSRTSAVRVPSDFAVFDPTIVYDKVCTNAPEFSGKQCDIKPGETLQLRISYPTCDARCGTETWQAEPAATGSLPSGSTASFDPPVTTGSQTTTWTLRTTTDAPNYNDVINFYANTDASPDNVALRSDGIELYVTRPSSGFTISGSIPVQPNPSQDTHGQTPKAKCNSVKFRADEALGTEVVGAFGIAHLPVSALLLAYFLSGRGTEVDFPAGSNISNQAQNSREFNDLNTAVQAEVVRQLNAGNHQINLAAPPLTTIRFGGSGDLYWGFRGTQGLAVSGNGSIQNGNYVGTLTYVIKDSYGFPPNDKLDYFGPPMRYLQTACGAPQHKGGARWFPDTITVTVPFNQPVGQ